MTRQQKTMQRFGNLAEEAVNDACFDTMNPEMLDKIEDFCEWLEEVRMGGNPFDIDKLIKGLEQGKQVGDALGVSAFDAIRIAEEWKRKGKNMTPPKPTEMRRKP